MSRCFPFPPPGYERKARNEDHELLEKEKHREKKHKKEKKDKEKREGKEKREKDRGDGKHKDKKDKKEKSKDRDKKKDGDKAKDKSKITEEKRSSVQTEAHVAEKLGQKENTQKNNIVEKKISGQIGAHKPEKLNQINNSIDDSKFVKEFDRRIKDESAGIGNISSGDRRKDEGVLRLVTKGSNNLAPVKENDKKIELKMVHNKLEELPRLVDKSVERKFEGSEKTNKDRVPSIDAMVHDKLEGLPRLVDTSVEKKLDGSEKTNKDKEKKSHGKDKDRDREKKREEREKRKEDKQKKREDKQRKKEDKEKKKEKEKAKVKNSEHEEKAKEIPLLKNLEPEKSRRTEKPDLVNNHTIKPRVLPKENDSNAPVDGNPKKRKDFETNGISHASNNLPSKVPRATPPSHPPLENGQVLEHSLTTLLPPVKKPPSNHIKMEIKDRKINGVTEAQRSPVSSTKVKHEKTVIEQAKASVKPPHPDARFLSQIYSVPELDERSDLNDQDWLVKPKKLKVDPTSSEEIPQVWDEAREIASADIFALPYVIPY